MTRNRSGLIVLQVVGGLSILPYPFVLLANVMSAGASSRTGGAWLFWVLASLYPIIWIVLDIFAWRAMSRGNIKLAFGLSGIPAASTVLGLGIMLFSWIGLGLGSVGIGSGGLHSQTYPTNNPVLDSVILADKDIQMGHDPAGSVERTLRQVDQNLKLINTSVAPYGSPLGVALSGLSVSLDGTLNGQENRIKLIRGLAARGARLSGEEASDPHKSLLLRRALYDGPARTAQ
jgi:hypothetical protein